MEQIFILRLRRLRETTLASLVCRGGHAARVRFKCSWGKENKVVVVGTLLLPAVFFCAYYHQMMGINSVYITDTDYEALIVSVSVDGFTCELFHVRPCRAQSYHLVPPPPDSFGVLNDDAWGGGRGASGFVDVEAVHSLLSTAGFSRSTAAPQESLPPHPHSIPIRIVLQSSIE